MDFLLITENSAFRHPYKQILQSEPIFVSIFHCSKFFVTFHNCRYIQKEIQVAPCAYKISIPAIIIAKSIIRINSTMAPRS